VLNFWVFIIVRHGSFFLPSGVDLDEFENKDPPTGDQIKQQLRRACLIRNERTCFASPTPSATGTKERVRKGSSLVIEVLKSQSVQMIHTRRK
jgi:hypothetical protein